MHISRAHVWMLNIFISLLSQFLCLSFLDGTTAALTSDAVLLYGSRCVYACECVWKDTMHVCN